MQEFKKPRIINPPDNKNNIWCPFDDWHMVDSYNNRRRLGEHLCNSHYKKVAVPKGQEPKDLEPEEKSNEYFNC